MKRYWEGLRPFEKRVVAVVASLLFVVFNVWFVFPHFSDWTTMNIRREKAQRTLKAYNAEISHTLEYESKLKLLRGEGLDVPPEDQALQFSRTVTDEIMKNGVNPQNVGRVTASTNQFFLEQSQPIIVQSGEQQLVDFLYNLGAGNSLIRVRELGVSPDPQRQQLSAHIKLVASYQKKTSAKPGVSPARTAAAAPKAFPNNPNLIVRPPNSNTK